MLVWPCKPQPCLANRPTRWLSRLSQQRWRALDPGISDSALAPLKGLRGVQYWSSAPRGQQDVAMLASQSSPVAQGRGQQTLHDALLVTSPSVKQHIVLGTMSDTLVSAPNPPVRDLVLATRTGHHVCVLPMHPEDRSVLGSAKAGGRGRTLSGGSHTSDPDMRPEAAERGKQEHQN